MKRIRIEKSTPAVFQAAKDLAKYTRIASKRAGLEPALYELVLLRCSQINGCTACTSLHSRNARDVGVPQWKLDILPSWRESVDFTDEERVALAYGEAVTLIHGAHTGELDSAYEDLLDIFTEEQIAALSWNIVGINLHNRISILSQHPAYTKD